MTVARKSFAGLIHTAANSGYNRAPIIYLDFFYSFSNAIKD